MIAHLIAKLSGLPRGRVVGTGTLLDSSRLIHAVSDQTGLDARGFFAFMMGEHGSAQMVPWSQVNFYGQTLEQMEEDPRFLFDKDKVQEKAIKGGWVTYQGKQCTEYGIASAAATLVRTIFHDEKRILPCSVELRGEYGEQDVFCGVPAVIGIHGVEEVLEYDLPDNEMKRLKECIDTIHRNIERGNRFLP